MSDKNSVNVAVVARFEENEKDFIGLINNGIVNYNGYKINFTNVEDEHVEEKVKKSIAISNKLILLINSIDGVTPKITNIIKELVKYKMNLIVVLNEISDSNSNPQMAIDEVDHVLVMENASDEQLEYPIVYLDDENKTATLNLEEEGKDFSALYNVIINK